jgi:SAM-dependent methyltransferase
MSFKDHFSDASAQYAEFRPTYPEALFAWLASQCPERELAWDCATGSGQAAAGLAPHFKQVAATDASAEQIAHASGPLNVAFNVAPAEASGLEGSSVDLIAVAQAAHWFDLPGFYAEARRVLKAGGVIVLWGYGRLALPGEMDTEFRSFYAETIGPYWPPERKLIDAAYRSLDFPFAEFRVPEFFIEVAWDLPRLLAYLSTWSAVKRFSQDTGTSPLPPLERALVPLWGSPEAAKRLKWPLFFRIGRV